MAPDSSGLPLDLWRGLDLTTFEELLARLDLPPRSPVLHQLWRRMLLSAATPPSGAPSPDHFLALRLEALYRSGTARRHDRGDRQCRLAPARSCWHCRARKDIGLGRYDEGCRTITTLAAPSSGLPGRLKGETQLLMGYCAAKAGDAPGADLAASLAREEGVEAELPLERAGRRCQRRQTAAAPAQARAAARLSLPRAARPGQRRADLRQGRAGAAGRAGGETQPSMRACASPPRRRRCVSTP